MARASARAYSEIYNNMVQAGRLHHIIDFLN